MKKSRFTESQIVTILKQADAGMKVEQVCRQAGISSATYYNWKSKYGGMEASDVKRLKELEDENSRLKKMFANLSLENEAIKELLAKYMRGVKSCAVPFFPLKPRGIRANPRFVRRLHIGALCLAMPWGVR